MEIKGMNYPKFQHDLNIALESEILGELIFLNAAQHARSIEQQQKGKTLAQLETQTLQRLGDFLVQQGHTASIRPQIKLQAKDQVSRWQSFLGKLRCIYSNKLQNLLWKRLRE